MHVDTTNSSVGLDRPVTCFKMSDEHSPLASGRKATQQDVKIVADRGKKVSFRIIKPTVTYRLRDFC